MTQEYSLNNSLRGSFEKQLYSIKDEIEVELSKLVSRYAKLRFNELIDYAVLSHGKRLRPLLVILSAQSVGGNREKVMKLALAVELLHTATLVHDDILDQDKFRRDIVAVHEKWSTNDAILTGDALISLAINLLADYGKDVTKIASEAGLSLCDGQFMDLSMTSLKTSEIEYLEKTRKKSASLFKAATHCGAKAGGASDSEVICLKDFGEHLGIAYQLNDDLSDITSMTEGIPKDLRKRRITLPLIHLYKFSNLVEREELERDLQILEVNDVSLKKTSLSRILQNLETKGSLSYCRKQTNKFIELAIADIEPLEETVSKHYLVQMAKTIRYNVYPLHF